MAAAAADYPSPRESRFGRLVSKLNSGLSPAPSPTHATPSTQSRSPSPAAAAAYDSAQQDMHHDNPSTPVRYVAAGGSLSRAAGAGAVAVANSPALSDIDDIPVRPPVFESRFMRELELHNAATATVTEGTTVASTSASRLSPRPPLAVSYSSPAAVSSSAARSSSPQYLGSPTAASFGTSPVSAPGSASGSLKSRLVRVASSSSLFSAASSRFTSSAAAAAIDNNNLSQSHVASPGGGGAGPSSSSQQQHTHRKTTSLLTGSADGTPSPRARLAASLARPGPGQALHRHHYSEDVRHLHRHAHTEDAENSSPRSRHATAPGSAVAGILGIKDGNANHSTTSLGQTSANGGSGNDRWQKSKDTLFSGLGSLGRKRSMDGLSALSSTSVDIIPEEEPGPAARIATSDASNPREAVRHTDPAEARYSTASTSTASTRTSQSHSDESRPPTQSRPGMSARVLSSESIDTTMDGPSTSSRYANLKSTPGFPRVPTSSSALHATASTAGTAGQTGISSGLSESSKRFRSAFRLNKSRSGAPILGGGAAGPGSRADGEAPNTGGLSVRRAMRVPLSQQLQEQQRQQQQQEEDEDAATGQGRDTTLEDSHASLRSASASINLSSILSVPSPPDASSARAPSHATPAADASTAHERAQLVPSLPTVLESSSAHHARQTSSLSLRPRRDAQPDEASAEEAAAAAPRAPSPRDSPASGAAGPMPADLSRAGRIVPGPFMKHSRSTSRIRLDDLVLVPDTDVSGLPASSSSTSIDSEGKDSDTLIARQQQQLSQQQSQSQSRRSPPPQLQSDSRHQSHIQAQAPCPQPAPRRAGRENASRDEEEVEMLLEMDKENQGQYDRQQHAQSRSQSGALSQKSLSSSAAGLKAKVPVEKEDDLSKSRYSPPMLGDSLKQRQMHAQQNSLVRDAAAPTTDRESERVVLGDIVRKQPSQPDSLRQPLQKQSRGAKLSSSSSNGGLGYHPSDRQVLVNDYAVPTKRGADTPPDDRYHYLQPQAIPPYQPQNQSHAIQQNQSHQQDQQQAARPPPTLPPTSSLPAPPLQQQQQQQVAEPQQPARRTTGTVTVKGKTYTRMGLLGRGGSSKVFRVSDRDHQVFALKKVDLGKGADSETYQSFLNEIDLLERLRGHDRIIQLVASEVNEARRSLIMVMEIGEIDLNALLQERTGKSISMNFIRHTWEQMLEAVYVIHEQGIVHTDLKPANFVLVKGALKLIDFGIAKAIPNDTTNIARDQQIGTANYMSPEALNPHISHGPRGERVMKLGRPSDVWSLGCILYQIVYGHTPFGRIKNLAAKMNAIQTPGYQIDFPTHAVPTTLKGEAIPDLAVRVEADLLKCMKDCLRYEPKRRATIPELLEDPFLRIDGHARAASATAETEGDNISPDLMSAIVANTLKWSQGRTPSRGEQERFVEAMLRQLQQQQATTR